MGRIQAAVAVVAVALMGAGCGGGSDTAAKEETTTTTAPTTTTAAPTTTTTTTPPPSSTTAAPVVLMPDVVCSNLQDAQDEIQRAGVFLSHSEDASGQGRNQVIDSNWLVVRQTPAPGTPVEEGDPLLYVVKYGEANDCGL